jgi:hypothetical protein
MVLITIMNNIKKNTFPSNNEHIVFCFFELTPFISLIIYRKNPNSTLNIYLNILKSINFINLIPNISKNILKYRLLIHSFIIFIFIMHIYIYIYIYIYNKSELTFSLNVFSNKCCFSV